MAGFLAGLLPITARLLGGNLIKSAYGGGAMGLMNLGMDVIPLAMDIANNDVGLKSFSSFGGTMLGTKFGGRELNKLGETNLEKAKRGQTIYYNNLPRERKTVSRDEWLDSQAMNTRKQLESNPKTSRQGYNMPIGFAADAGLYSLTSGMGKPRESSEVDTLLKQQEMANSPVSRYIQMTGGM